MQVPEKLSLIGGSILLVSTLIFTLKSQASNILPKIAQPIHNIQSANEDLNAQHGSSFDKQWYQAKQQGQRTGEWGSSKWYVDKDMNMHIGSGSLHGRLYDAIGQDVFSIHSISLDDNIQAPQDSRRLFSGVDDANKDWNFNIKNINGLDRLDTSNVQDMFYLFANDAALQSVDLSHWDTSNVTSMDGMFINNSGLKDLNASQLNVSKVKDFGWMFLRDGSLHKLDLSGWHPSGNNQPNMQLMFAGASYIQELDIDNFDTTNTSDDDFFSGKYNFATNNNLHKLVLGSNTAFRDDAGVIDGTWQNGSQTLSADQFKDNNAHPGTWIKQ